MEQIPGRPGCAGTPGPPPSESSRGCHRKARGHLCCPCHKSDAWVPCRVPSEGIKPSPGRTEPCPARFNAAPTRREPSGSPALLLGTQTRACVPVPPARGHSPGATGSRPCPAPLAPTRPGHAWGLKQRGKERKEAPAEPGEARLRIQAGRGGWERPLAGHNAPVLNINPRERPGRRASVFA